MRNRQKSDSDGENINSQRDLNPLSVNRQAGRDKE